VSVDLQRVWFYTPSPRKMVDDRTILFAQLTHVASYPSLRDAEARSAPAIAATRREGLVMEE
jgi:hypothetical protein